MQLVFSSATNPAVMLQLPRQLYVFSDF